MLSGKGIQKAPGYRNYLEIEAAGYWVGTGAERLGLKGRVTAEQFKNIRQGLHPGTEEKLRRSTPADRVYTLFRKIDQTPFQKVYKGCELYDLNLGAPKTVSILNLEDDRAYKAHVLGVANALKVMQAKCGEMVVAKYDHHYSRSIDPHMHTHLVAANLAWDGKKWRTLHYSNIVRAQAEITDAYRRPMLAELATYGYRINYPDVAGISPELADKFSQRSHHRDELIEEHRRRHAIGPTEKISGNEIGILMSDNRQPKIGISYAQYLEFQRDKLTQAERLSLRQTVEKAYERSHKLRLHVDVAEGEESGPSLRPATYGQRISM